MSTAHDPAQSQPDLMLALELSLMSEAEVRAIVDEVTDMGSTPTPRQTAAAADLKRRGAS